MTATVLRFEYPGFDLVSPVIIRFEDGPIPPLPAIGDIWSMVDFTWTDLLQTVGTDTALVNYTQSHEHQCELVTGHYASVTADIYLTYGIVARIGMQITLPWEMRYTHDSQHSIDWGFLSSLTTETVISWQGITPQAGADYSIVWSDNQLVLTIDTNFYYEGLPVAEAIQCDVVWRSGADQAESEQTIKWGPHAPRWICSTSAPLVKGLATIRFKVEGVAVTGPVTLRFIAEPEYCYYDDGGGLIDAGPDLPNFDFDIPIEPQIRRVYLMQPELLVTRVSDNVPIIVQGVTITNGRGNFTGSFSIDFSSKGDADNAMNQLLLVEINGYSFYGLPEQLSRRQSFGRAEYSATGRTRTAQLAAPWRLPISYSNTVDRTLGGILADILTTSGWSAQLVGFSDFNVPAGVFSITGKAPIECVADIADMIGCMVVEDEVASVLKIVPRWPVVPWEMAAAVAAINIHDAVIISLNSQDEINQLCNASWVRGNNQGVSRRVRRSGTAGNIPTEDSSAALIVSDIPARLLGTSKIVNTGLKQRVTVSLPVMNDLPPLVKGMLIGVSYFGEVYKATCDSVTIAATVDTNGSIDVTQSANLIRHMEWD